MRRVTSTAKIFRAPTGVDSEGYPLSESNHETWEAIEWPVFSVSPRVASEDFDAHRQAVSLGIRVSAPLNGPRPNVDDIVRLKGFEAGGDFEVDGEVQVWDKNPLLSRTLHAHIIVNLIRHRR